MSHRSLRQHDRWRVAKRGFDASTAGPEDMLFDTGIGRARGIVKRGVIPKSAWTYYPGNPFDAWAVSDFGLTLPEAPLAACAFLSPNIGTDGYNHQGALPNYSYKSGSNIWTLTWYTSGSQLLLFIYGNATLSAAILNDTTPQAVSYVVFMK
jgi:hypothetical protein